MLASIETNTTQFSPTTMLVACRDGASKAVGPNWSDVTCHPDPTGSAVPWWDIVSEVDIAAIREAWELHFEGRAQLDAWFTVRDHPDKCLRLFGTSTHTNRSETKEVLAFLSDVSGWIDAIESFQRHETRAKSIMQAAADGVVVIDGSHRITAFNPAAEELFGYSEAEVLGRDLSLLMPPDKGANHHALVRRATSADNKTRRMGGGRDVQGLRSDGSLIWLEASVVFTADPQGVAIIRDVTERKKLDQMKADFVSTVSHELRTPLTAIRASLGLLEAGALGQLPSEATRAVELATVNTTRLIQLINDLLDMDRLDSGRVSLELEPCSVVEIVGFTVNSMRVLAEARNISLETATDESMVWADRNRLIQALTNLLGNAIKFSDDHSRVIVTAAGTNGGFVEFSVSDEGTGIAADQISNIFNRFVLADSSDSRSGTGTGLGLPISKTLIEQHGGSIRVESELGVGSVFIFDLPGYHPDAAVDTRGESATRVLILEQDPTLQEILATILRSQGFPVTCIAKGRSLQSVLEAQHFGLILFDDLTSEHANEVLTFLAAQPAGSRPNLAALVTDSQDAELPSNPLLDLDLCLTKGQQTPEKAIEAILGLFKERQAATTDALGTRTLR